MIYNVLDICRYVIGYSNDKDYGISNLKLQKILYFIQAYFLISKPNNAPCFKEKIEAWDFGPVVAEAYHQYKQYGSCDIPNVTSYIELDKNNIWNTKRIEFTPPNIANDDKKLINAVIDKFKNYSATDLVTITHHQDPWCNAYNPKYPHNEITPEAIRTYFDE